ncbi:queuosine precursor transporter, partial [Mycobacterium kansasii]
MYFVSILFYMGITVLSYKRFGKTGLYVWSALSVIVANLEAMKMVTMFGLSATLGNAVYASSFLVTDILSEKYGRKSATKAV